MNNQQKIEAYGEIKRTLEKYMPLVRETQMDITDALAGAIKIAELSDVFGFQIPQRYTTYHNVLSGWIVMGDGGAHAIEKVILMGEKYRRTISWPDDGRQPDDEWLYSIGFSTGAYVFGDHYPTALFKSFWLELLELSPKYKDSANKTLYFSPENAAHAKERFAELLEKYKRLAEKDKQRMRREKLQKELDELRDKSNTLNEGAQ